MFVVLCRYAREQAFKAHPLVSHLSETLLHVFVSIEMTGQAVEFEQKFNYRRPMYLTLDYIWEIELHQEAIKVTRVFWLDDLFSSPTLRPSSSDSIMTAELVMIRAVMIFCRCMCVRTCMGRGAVGLESERLLHSLSFFLVCVTLFTVAPFAAGVFSG